MQACRTPVESGFRQDAANPATKPALAGTLGRFHQPGFRMWLLLLEAGMALFLLIFIVWWTMFHGRKPEHPPARPAAADKTVDKTATRTDGTPD